MIMKYKKFGFNIPVNGVQTLVIENSKSYREFILNLLSQINGKEGELKFYENIEEKNMKNKIIFAGTPFFLDINNRRIIDSLYKNMEEVMLSERFDEYKELEIQIYNFLSSLLVNEHIDVELDEEIDVKKLFQSANIRISDLNESDDLLESISQYVSVIKKYTNIEIIIFTNVRAMFEHEEWQMLVNDIKKSDICMFNIETYSSFIEVPGEKLYIIDKDLCEIF